VNKKECSLSLNYKYNCITIIQRVGIFNSKGNYCVSKLSHKHTSYLPLFAIFNSKGNYCVSKLSHKHTSYLPLFGIFNSKGNYCVSKLSHKHTSYLPLASTVVGGFATATRKREFVSKAMNRVYPIYLTSLHTRHPSIYQN